MNSFLNTLLDRRSCRSFEKRAVEREKLELIASAACHAPTARNRQLWQFTVVTDGALLEGLRAAVAATCGRGEDYNFYDPAAMILCSNARENPYGREDCACAMQNILLSCHALSLGAVWINQLTATCDTEEVRAVLRRLGVPEDHVVYGCAAIGYPAAAPAEKDVRHAVVWN